MSDERTSATSLTVIVTTHAEGRLLRPTLRSVAASLAHVVQQGDGAELIVVCDSADDATSTEVGNWIARKTLEFPLRVLSTNLGESGAARNAGVAAAEGEFVALVDGDDLVSENYFAAGLDQVRASGGRTLVHPALVLSFGPRSLLWQVDSMSTGGFDYRDLLRHNLWPSASIGRRELYLEHPYPSLAPGKGYGPEDWVWNISTTSAGIVHDAVPDTMFFYRLRESGGINNRHAASLLPPFDVEALRRALPIEPVAEASARRSPRERARAAARRAYAAALPAARRATANLSPEARTLVYRSLRGGLSLLVGRRSGIRRVHATPQLLADLAAAAELDPAISSAASEFEKIDVWHARDDGYAAVLDLALLELGDVGALVAVPWVGVGGADLVSRNYARALNGTDRFAGRTAMLGTYLSERTRLELVPPGVRYVHLDERWLRITFRWRQRLLAQLITLLQPELIVSVNCFHLTESLSLYDRQVTDGIRVFATMFSFDRIGRGYPANPITDDSQRRYLDRIAAVLTDNSRTAERVSDILALDSAHLLVQRQPASAEVPELDRETAAYRDEAFSRDAPFRLVWPHRLDTEKRPDAVVRIARALKARGLPVQVDVWGQRVLGNHGSSIMDELKSAGVVYRGPYSGGLTSLPTKEYHALLLTSESEGLPLVLVESMLAGLPVVASAVGGVPDIVLDGETGLLVSGPDDVEGFATAVERLLASRGLRRSLIDRGYAFAAEHHSWQAFQSLVERTLIA